MNAAFSREASITQAASGVSGREPEAVGRIQGVMRHLAKHDSGARRSHRYNSDRYRLRGDRV